MHFSRGLDKAGFTLIEVLVVIGVLALILFMVSPVFLVKAESNRRVIEESLPALIGESLRDAVRVGARENYDRKNNTFFFDFDGIRIHVRSLAPGEKVDIPFDASPPQGIYPLGPVYFTAEQMVVNGVALGPLTDGAGNGVRGEFVGLPVDEDLNGNRVLDTGEDINESGLLETLEDTNGNGLLDAGEDLNGDGFLYAPDRRAFIGPYLPDRSDFYRNYGYTLEIIRPSIAPRYELTIRIFSRFFDVRPGLKSASYSVLKARAEPEVGVEATNCNDDDQDGIVDDQPVFTDKPAGTLSPPCGTHHGRGTSETLLNGMDDDGDGVIDDGVILPSREMKVAIHF